LKTSATRRPSASADEIGVGQQDLEHFERLLKEMQAAYANEDYASLRRITTPEAMSYLAEELSENATRGLKNEVRDVHLVQGDVSESWREGNVDYATVAMRYESIDVLRPHQRQVASGDPAMYRIHRDLTSFGAWHDWQISAIQIVKTRNRRSFEQTVRGLSGPFVSSMVDAQFGQVSAAGHRYR
jgi:predicted lipid-binding transport protein (Tim44 family)